MNELNRNSFSKEIKKIENQTFNTFMFENKLPMIQNEIFKHKDDIHTQAFLLNYFKLPTIKEKQNYYNHQILSRKKILNNNNNNNSSNNVRNSIKSINSNLNEKLNKLSQRKSSLLFLEKNIKSRNINSDLKSKTIEEILENPEFSFYDEEEKNKKTPFKNKSNHISSYSYDLSTNNKTNEKIPRLISAFSANKNLKNQKNEINKNFDLNLDKIQNYSNIYYNKLMNNIIHSDRYEKRMIVKSKKRLKKFNKKHFVDTSEFIKELELKNDLSRNIKVNKFFDKLISEKKHFDLIVLRNMLRDLNNSTKVKRRIIHKEELEKMDKKFHFYIEDNEMRTNRIYKSLNIEK